ncbi:MAG: hypothetical protein ACM3JH_06970 [Acidithiobacillales bacterium]
MTPEEYMNRYLHCPVWLSDDSVREVRIDQYLNHGESSNSDAAWRAYESLIQGLARLTRTRAFATRYEKDGWTFETRLLRRAFVGKGSPSNIQDVYLAASFCGLVTMSNAQDYANRYLGTDCNGFVGNYFGLDPNTSISSYDSHPRNRRSRADEIQARDVVVFLDSAGGHKHIALVHGVRSVAGRTELTLVQSRSEVSGGVQSGTETVTFQTDRAGHIYYVGPLRRHAYLVPAASDGGPAE